MWTARRKAEVQQWPNMAEKMPGVSCYSDYTIETKMQAGQSWGSRAWLCKGPVPPSGALVDSM